MTAALTTLVAWTILYRKDGEVSYTAPSPVKVFNEDTDEPKLEETGSFLYSSDDWRLVTCNKYEAREIHLPGFLAPDEWIRDCVAWKFAWAAGVDPTWPEAWQRGLLELSTAQQSAASTLLRTKKFRSAFRQSLRDQIVAWLETPVDDRSYSSPLSRKQWGCIVRADDRRTGKYIYSRRGGYWGCPKAEA